MDPDGTTDWGGEENQSCFSSRVNGRGMQIVSSAKKKCFLYFVKVPVEFPVSLELNVLYTHSYSKEERLRELLYKPSVYYC